MIKHLSRMVVGTVFLAGHMLGCQAHVVAIRKDRHVGEQVRERERERERERDCVVLFFLLFFFPCFFSTPMPPAQMACCAGGGSYSIYTVFIITYTIRGQALALAGVGGLSK